MINSEPASCEYCRPLMTFASSLDPDEALQNVGPHLRSKLFDTQISYQKKLMENNIKYLKFIRHEEFTH